MGAGCRAGGGGVSHTTEERPPQSAAACVSGTGRRLWTCLTPPPPRAPFLLPFPSTTILQGQPAASKGARAQAHLTAFALFLHP